MSTIVDAKARPSERQWHASSLLSLEIDEDGETGTKQAFAEQEGGKGRMSSAPERSPCSAMLTNARPRLEFGLERSSIWGLTGFKST